jgi:putative hydrolase of the HAD superfamily
LARALIVDLFGTLVPKWSEEISVARKRRMAETAGVEERVFRNAWGKTWLDRELGRVSLEQCIADVLDRVAAPVAPDTVARLRNVWLGPAREHLTTTPRPDAIATLERARAAGWRIGLVSNAGPEMPEVFRSSPLSDLIDVAVFSCAAGVAKPDRRIYLSVCQALRVAPESCVYVGDGGDHELQGALEVGMTPILLRVESEIAKEGLPPGAADWKGAEIETFQQLWPRLRLDAR